MIALEQWGHPWKDFSSTDQQIDWLDLNKKKKTLASYGSIYYLFLMRSPQLLSDTKEDPRPSKQTNKKVKNCYLEQSF